jgi:hypothetical protein
MPEAKKPSWVEALDEAKKVLATAADQDTPECTDSKTRLAYAWMEVARMQKSSE